MSETLQVEDSTVDELAEIIVEAVENDARISVFDYEVERHREYSSMVEVSVTMAVKETESLGLNELDTPYENVEVRIGSKGGGSPYASLGVRGEFNY